MNYDIYYCSSQKQVKIPEELFSKFGVNSVHIPQINDPEVDRVIDYVNPNIVIYDRFITEEQFNWRIRERCPDAVTFIDTQDLHFLRHIREHLKNNGSSITETKNFQISLNNTPDHLMNGVLRELSSMHRTDATIVSSSFERDYLIHNFNFPAEKIIHAPFFYSLHQRRLDFNLSKRKDFVVIGNFSHLPNKDALLWLKQSIWSKIRDYIPNAKLHVYGANPTKEDMELTDESESFYVKGPIKEDKLFLTLSKYRVNLAPLRFGAGIKGKVVDNWIAGTPTVTTSIGSEGMDDDGTWGGLIANTEDGFVEAATTLYLEPKIWKECQNDGFRLLNDLFEKKMNENNLQNDMNRIIRDAKSMKNRDWIKSILFMNSNNYMKELSKKIEIKEALTKKIQNLKSQNGREDNISD